MDTFIQWLYLYNAVIFLCQMKFIRLQQVNSFKTEELVESLKEENDKIFHREIAEVRQNLVKENALTGSMAIMNEKEVVN